MQKNWINLKRFLYNKFESIMSNSTVWRVRSSAWTESLPVAMTFPVWQLFYQIVGIREMWDLCLQNKMQSSVKNTYLSPQNTNNPRQFPSISQPKIVGSFSLNENREYLPDARNCQYVYKNYHSGRINFDLNEGMEHVIRKPEFAKDEKITHLLDFISRNRQKLKKDDKHDDRSRFLSSDVVCFRGLLRLIMCTPYEHKDAWIILATKYKGTIYLCALDTEKQIQDRTNQSATQTRIFSYGFKFEQYILSGKSHGWDKVTKI